MTPTAKDIRHWFDDRFLDHLKMAGLITAEEEAASNERSIRYEKQWEEYRNDQRNKYGLDGGPSPAIIMLDPFKPS